MGASSSTWLQRWARPSSLREEDEEEEEGEDEEGEEKEGEEEGGEEGARAGAGATLTAAGC